MGDLVKRLIVLCCDSRSEKWIKSYDPAKSSAHSNSERSSRLHPPSDLRHGDRAVHVATARWCTPTAVTPTARQRVQELKIQGRHTRINGPTHDHVRFVRQTNPCIIHRYFDKNNYSCIVQHTTLVSCIVESMGPVTHFVRS